MSLDNLDVSHYFILFYFIFHSVQWSFFTCQFCVHVNCIVVIFWVHELQVNVPEKKMKQVNLKRIAVMIKCEKTKQL